MEEKNEVAVSRLEEIAFMASYREIVSTLLLCPDHLARDVQDLNMNTSSFISLNPVLPLSSPNILKFVRRRLKDNLLGIMNVREKLIHQFNLDLEKKNWNGRKCDIWAFLDCVLDSRFTELQTHVCSLSSYPNEKLTKVIAKRSPNIKKLKLNFLHVHFWLGPKFPVEPLLVPLSSLADLTSLTLENLRKRNRSLLSYLGYSCPKLQHLCISGFKMVRKDIIALVLGEKLESIQEKETLLKEENNIHHLQMSPEYIAPLCSSLQWLQLEDNSNQWQEPKRGLPPTVMAFMIRHMPNLCKIDYFSTSVSYAVKLLNSIKDEFSEEPLSWKTNSPFYGTLSLTSLDFVNIANLEMMMAVGNMCPNLKEVDFVYSDDLDYVDDLDAFIASGENAWDDRMVGVSYKLSKSEELSPLLPKWSKVERVTFREMCRYPEDDDGGEEYTTTVLSSIGAQLLHVTFLFCENLKINDLLPCTRLEGLKIFHSYFDPDCFVDSEIFLPKLVCLETKETCLGEMSRTFEEKLTIKHLDLECCHVNTKNSSMNWSNIGKCWKRIQTLRIQECSGLNMALVKSMYLQMPKLRELVLPRSMLDSNREREMARELMEELNRGYEKISLNFHETSSHCCRTIND